MPDTWYKVDNVANVFLASVTRRDPRVFRVSCTLKEEVDPDVLAAADAVTLDNNHDGVAAAIETYVLGA